MTKTSFRKNFKEEKIVRSFLKGSSVSLVFDYYLILEDGQSNKVGRKGPIDGTLDATNADILQPNTDAGAGTVTSLITAADPLNHWDAGGNTIGNGLTLAKLLLPDVQVLNPNGKIVIIPSARGATGFDDNWRPGDTEYEESKSRFEEVTALIEAEGKTWTVLLVNFHQGEADNGRTQENYSDLLFTYIARKRDYMGSQKIPFVCGDLMPSASLGGARLTLQGIKSNVPYSGFAASTDFVGDGVDTVHFTAAEQRTFGQRYYDAYNDLSGNLSATPPGTVSDLAASDGEGETVLTFTLPSTGGLAIRNTVIEYKLTADSTWTEFYPSNGVAKTSPITVSGLAAGNYDFRIKVLSAAGIGSYSNTATATITNAQVRAAANTVVSGPVFDMASRNTNSYDGSGQTFFNLGSGPDFFLGTTSGVDSEDPTFVPASGSVEAHFLHVGTTPYKYFTAASVIPFTQNLHRTDLGGSFTFIARLRPKSTFRSIFATTPNATDSGLIFWAGGNKPRLRFYTSGTTPKSIESSATYDASAINTIAATFDHSTLDYSFRINATQENGTTGAFTALGSNESNPTLMADTSGNFGFDVSTELYDLIVYACALPEAQLSSLFTLVEGN